MKVKKQTRMTWPRHQALHLHSSSSSVQYHMHCWYAARTAQLLWCTRGTAHTSWQCCAHSTLVHIQVTPTSLAGLPCHDPTSRFDSSLSMYTRGGACPLCASRCRPATTWAVPAQRCRGLVRMVSICIWTSAKVLMIRSVKGTSNALVHNVQHSYRLCK